jgi:hypothetical protein
VGFLYSLVVVEPCGFVLTMGNIGELLFFPGEQLVKLVNGQNLSFFLQLQLRTRR